MTWHVPGGRLHITRGKTSILAVIEHIFPILHIKIPQKASFMCRCWTATSTHAQYRWACSWVHPPKSSSFRASSDTQTTRGLETGSGWTCERETRECFCCCQWVTRNRIEALNKASNTYLGEVRSSYSTLHMRATCVEQRTTVGFSQSNPSPSHLSWYRSWASDHRAPVYLSMNRLRSTALSKVSRSIGRNPSLLVLAILRFLWGPVFCLKAVLKKLPAFNLWSIYPQLFLWHFCMSDRSNFGLTHLYNIH